EMHRSEGPETQMLDRLVALHVATAVEERALLTVWIQDWQSLPEEDQRRIRHRQVEYVSVSVQALVRLRPELSPAEAEAVVHAAIGAINSVAFHDAGLGVAPLETLLTSI